MHVRLALTLLVIVFAFLPARAQSPPQARKFDEFTEGIGSLDYRFGTYERHDQEEKKRIAAYARELRRVGARPYAITYGPRIVPWEIYDRSIAEMRASSLWTAGLSAFFDWRNINVVNGGFREVAATELWIVPPGAQPPCPTPTVTEAQVAHCPHVRIEGVPYVPPPGGPLTFRAKVNVNSDRVKPRFVWQVSIGEIVAGQGTDSITVSVPESAKGEVVARLKLEGFSLECPAQATTATARTAFGVRHVLLDEFGNINEEDELARLDYLAITVQQDPRLQIHIVFYGGRFSQPNEALRRAERAKDYLVKSRGLEADRVLPINGGYRDEVSGEYWLSLRGTEAPASRPTIDPKFVKPRKRIR
ncbi:MAG TPA: hypothetical protein VFZ40_02145 [Pyrinomonadaceae bacterium]